MIRRYDWSDTEGLPATVLDVLKMRETLTGHVDVARLEKDGLIDVWDYKPRAGAERNAHVQVFLYALRLALRTGLPLRAFTCGYFDERDAYVFCPTEARLEARLP